ncbi:MAG TPA: methionyl-tRNA formyltransferase [Bacteroidales bacterium]|nr:methionyl-tRNA formyltransferase [Bacteroidales bacterium]
MRIVFMGTPEFAVESLKILVENNYEIAAVITVPDKPAGRGQQIQESPVKKYAVEKGLRILQPASLKDEQFLDELKQINPDLQVVVAFRMLPEAVWSLPTKGTFNLHASLLPQYRGAAPINHAIINGEERTGVTTFFLDKEIDTGKIISVDYEDISETDTAGEVHDRLMLKGARLVLKTVRDIETGAFETIDQSAFIADPELLKKAPKIFKEDCKISWTKDVDDINNLIRGLSPYPCAWSEFITPDREIVSFKIYKSEKIQGRHRSEPGSILTDNKTHLYITGDGGLISVTEIQTAGKKRMSIGEFLRGSKINESWKCI